MGYNYSIYLMAGMPYLLLASVGGFFVYLGLRNKPTTDDPLQAGDGGASPPPGLPDGFDKPFGPPPAGDGGIPCPPSIDEGSQPVRSPPRPPRGWPTSASSTRSRPCPPTMRRPPRKPR